jgi:tRNA (Thr-GGU) A37 N-methylase
LHGLAPGDRVLVLYWMHDLAHQDRRSLRVHPGGRIEADARRLLLAQLYPAEPDRR